MFAPIETAESKPKCHASHDNQRKVRRDSARQDRIDSGDQHHAPVEEDQNFAQAQILERPCIGWQDGGTKEKESDDDGGETCIEQDEHTADYSNGTCCDKPTCPILFRPELMHEWMNSVLA